MAIQDSDAFLVARSGTNYQTPASDIMAIEDTDLLVVNRGGTNYKATGEELIEYTAGGKGKVWEPVNGLPAGTGLDQVSYCSDSGIFVGCRTNSGASQGYISTDGGTTWQARTMPAAVAGSILVSGRDAVSFYTSNGTRYTSADGSSWSSAQTPLPAGTPMGAVFQQSNGYTVVGGKTSTGSWAVAFNADRTQRYDIPTQWYWATDGYQRCYPTSGVYTSAQQRGVAGFWIIGGAGGITYRGNGYFGIQDPQTVTTSVRDQGDLAYDYVSACCLVGDEKTVASVSFQAAPTEMFVHPFPAQVATSQSNAQIGQNTIAYMVWEPQNNIVIAVGSGGAITVSYDEGVTWEPSYFQYRIPDVAESNFTSAAVGSNSVIAGSLKTVVRSPL